ncbi:putative metabolite transport protein YwtG isoform X2 [Lutzomyia longipalpis]|uniref:putative metabolite transport protein YwtG isoform X2 n=1 Tax=Lutzomyia longipalpis TaxID=7200 RepID=UPI0024839BF7|nr:putative metabolite transport protein YwtG isoform X2 [Lutzomyia longipalpis]
MTGNGVAGGPSSPSESSTSNRMCNFPYSTVFVASLGYFIIGNSIAWSSHAIFFLLMVIPPPFFILSEDPDVKFFYVIASLSFVATLIPLVVYKMLNAVSLKSFLILAAFFATLSWVVPFVGDSIGIPPLYGAIGGRLMGGVAVGVFHFLVPIYLEDLMASGSCKDTRLLIDNVLCTQFAMGVLTQYGAGYLHSRTVIALLSLIPALLITIGLFFIPQSPRYLCNVGRNGAARDILRQFRGMLRYSEDTKQIDADIDFWSSKQDQIAFGTIFENVNSIKLLFPTLGLIFWEQMIGIVVIFFYLIPCLHHLYDGDTGIVETLLVASGFIVGTILGAFTRFRINPKYLLVSCGIIMGILLIIIGNNDLLQRSTNRAKRNFGYIPAVCFAIFLLFYAFGYRRSVSVYQHHLIERKKLLLWRSLSVTIAWATVTFIAWIFAYGWPVVGLGWILIFIGCISLLAVVFIVACVPSSIERDLSHSADQVESIDNIPGDSML